MRVLEKAEVLNLQALSKGRGELIISFLALLELAKEGLVHLWQAEDFGPLWASKSLGKNGICYG